MSVGTIELARATADAVRAIAGVADLDAGAVGEFATYGAGERVGGVRVRAPRDGDAAKVALRLVVRYGYPLPELTDRVRSTVREVVHRLAGADAVVDLHVVDVAAQEAPPELSGVASPPAGA